MRIVFIYNATENLGIEYISSVLKSHGHETHLLFDPAVFSGDIFINVRSLANLFNVDNAIVRKVLELQPDVIAFSAYTGNYRWCLKIARAIREQYNAPIVFGGVHVTAVPERVLANDCVDYVIIGEGEYAFLDLLDHLEGGGSTENVGDIPNICYRRDDMIVLNAPRPYIKDIDSLPFPDKDLFFEREPLLALDLYLIMTSRGCPYNCTYCSNNMYHAIYCDEKKHVRRRSPGNVIDELVWIKNRVKIKTSGFPGRCFHHFTVMA